MPELKLLHLLDPREAECRRQVFEQKIKNGEWYACVSSNDLRYHVPILINQGKYRLSLPNAFRNLGLKATNKKYYSSARTAAENMILQAAAVLGEQPPLFEHFGPAERVKWKRTRNLLHGKEQSAGDIQFVRFRPIEVGWSPLIRHVLSLKCTLATKVVLLYAYLRGFESGQFWASSQNTSVDTDVHKVHIKRIFPWLVKHRHFEKLNREAEGTWRYAFLAPSDFINPGNFKLPLNEAGNAPGNPKLHRGATLGSSSGNVELHKSDVHSLPTQTDDDKRASSRISGQPESLSSGEDKLRDEFAEWCRSQGGKPTERGFETWKESQSKKDEGFVLNRKFYTLKQANELAHRLAKQDPNIALKFKPAIRRGKKFEIIRSEASPG